MTSLLPVFLSILIMSMYLSHTPPDIRNTSSMFDILQSLGVMYSVVVFSLHFSNSHLDFLFDSVYFVLSHQLILFCNINDLMMNSRWQGLQHESGPLHQHDAGPVLHHVAGSVFQSWHWMAGSCPTTLTWFSA